MMLAQALDDHSARWGHHKDTHISAEEARTSLTKYYTVEDVVFDSQRCKQI